MNKKHGGASYAFMAELLMAVVMLAVCGGICVLVLVKADLMTRQSSDSIRAAELVQSEAERFKASPGPDGFFEKYYDSRWEQADSPAQHGYTLQLTVTTQGDMRACALVMRGERGELFSLEVKKFAGGAL